jgi:hypothetical protein
MPNPNNNMNAYNQALQINRDLKKQNNMVRTYLDKYWGYTKGMIDEVMVTGQTPGRAEYLDDGTMVEGKRLLTTIEKKANLEKYLLDVFGYTYKMVEEVQQTGLLDPALEPYPPIDNDPVSPQHYQQGNIQVIDFITDQKFDWIEGNIVKYISRYKTKNGVEDLKKAEFYIRRLIDENS